MPHILVKVEQSFIDKWGSHFNKLTPAQLERLAILGEEMAEAQHVIGKILRHGYTSRNPNESGSSNNIMLLQDELGHVAFAVSMLTEAGGLIRSSNRRAKRTQSTQHLKILTSQLTGDYNYGKSKFCNNE